MFVKRLVLGITAHVDAGKTTLAEAILYCTGSIRKLGRVDHRDAFLDTDTQERERGITIFSHQASFTMGEHVYTLLDTPGHVDFSAETERTMEVMDYAILLVSASDGIQSHTETLWHLLKHNHVPVFLFVNKMDLLPDGKEDVLEALTRTFGESCTDFSDAGTEAFYERIALKRESWMETYLQTGEVTLAQIQNGIAGEMITPVFFGSALKLEGVDAFLRGLDTYTRETNYPETFGARVYKIDTDDKGARQTHIKLTGGALHVRDTWTYTDLAGETHAEKVSQIRLYEGAKFTAPTEMEAGSVCAVTGLTATYAGQGLGYMPDAASLQTTPILRYQMQLPAGCDVTEAWRRLSRLREEEPTLHISRDTRTGEIVLQPMGEVQLEVLKRRIAEQYDLDVEFTAGGVAYRETIASAVEGVGHYEPLRHYAEVHVLLEPLPRGSGLEFDSICSEDDLSRNWQRLIMTHLEEKTHLGVLTGSPITDMRITLCSGRASVKHTEGGDFREATYRAVRNGLRKAESVLLEPVVQFTLDVPSTAVGRAMTDLQQMGGTISPAQTDGETTRLTGEAPARQLATYGADVAAYTRGAGKLSFRFQGYAPCQDADHVIEEIGYDCDADVDNSADSIFCKHGAGFLVPWDAVESYMHIPLQKDREVETVPTESTPVSHSGGASARDSFEEDAELMRIFERTYGKIQRDTRDALHTPKEESRRKKGPLASNTLGEDYLLVDGYNIIYAWDELKDIAQADLGAARTALEQILSNYNGMRQCILLLVYDAYRVPGQHREVEHHGNLDIIYTREAETADAYIEKAAHTLAKDNRVRVATSDGMEQMVILGQGALRISATELYREVTEASNAIHTVIQKYRAQDKPDKLGDLPTYPHQEKGV